MTFGDSGPEASHTLYCVAPGTLLQRRSKGAKTAAAPSNGAIRIERATEQSAGGVNVKCACDDSTPGQRSKSVRTNQSIVPEPMVRLRKVAVVEPARDGAPPSIESHSSCPMAFGTADQSNSTKPLVRVASFDGESSVVAELSQFAAAGIVNDCCAEGIEAQPSKSASTNQTMLPVVSVECSVLTAAGVVASGAKPELLIEAQTREPL